MPQPPTCRVRFGQPHLSLAHPVNHPLREFGYQYEKAARGRNRLTILGKDGADWTGTSNLVALMTGGRSPNRCRPRGAEVCAQALEGVSGGQTLVA
jgi:hypothetical protein